MKVVVITLLSIFVFTAYNANFESELVKLRRENALYKKENARLIEHNRVLKDGYLKITDPMDEAPFPRSDFDDLESTKNSLAAFENHLKGVNALIIKKKVIEGQLARANQKNKRQKEGLQKTSTRT